MRKSLLVSFLLLSAAVAWAVPASPNAFQVTQPDGSQIAVRLVGDEFHSYYTTLDATPLRKLESGFFVEDTAVVRESHLAKAKRVAHQQMLGGAFPLTGSPKSVVILVGFTDMPFAQSHENFVDLLNQTNYNYNGATGSARDYFIAASNGVFSPTFDVYGPYMLEHEMAYYGAPSGSSNDKNPGAMIAEACQLADADGVDFSQYDYNNDGVLDNVFVYYAGHNEAEGGGENTIWPHQSNISYKGIKVGGKTVASYACTSEYSGSTAPVRAAIGTFCHEFGHVLGLPDWYDTDYKNYTVGNWDIMCQGSYNNSSRTPPTYSSYERFYLGWLQPEQLSEKGAYMLEPLETSNKAYLIAASQHNLSGAQPNPSEFFMIEYRENVGWDEPSYALPGTGMLVWHIDYLASAWNNNIPNNGTNLLRMHLEEANGQGWQTRTNSESGRASDAYPYNGRYTSFTPSLHDGTSLMDQMIFDIVKNNKVSVSFVYQALGDAAVAFDKDNLDFLTTMSDKNTIVDWTPQQVLLTGEGVATDLSVSTTGNFYLSIAENYPVRGSSEWTKEVVVSPNADSIVNQKVWVMFKPTKQSCTSVASQVVVKGSGVSLSLPVTGLAARPVYVTVPSLKPTKKVTPYSFQIAWKPVTDAELYYVTLYQIEDGETTFTQSFESFASYDAIQDEGWESTTNLTTTSAKGDGSCALYLKNTGDVVTTETYPSAITAISFWINAFTSEADSVGVLKLEAFNGKKWKTVDDINVMRTTKKKTLSYSFSLDDNYTRFRLSYTVKNAGVALDVFEAICSQKINYIARGREMTIPASDDEAFNVCNVTDLTPETDYYYKVQCTDLDKGCEEHLTDFTAPVKVTTLAGVSPDDNKHLALAIDSINYDAVEHVIYIQNPTANGKLYFFDILGHQVYAMPTITGQSGYPIPTEIFLKGSVYIAKYVDSGNMKRKQRWIKFVF